MLLVRAGHCCNFARFTLGNVVQHTHTVCRTRMLHGQKHAALFTTSDRRM